MSRKSDSSSGSAGEPAAAPVLTCPSCGRAFPDADRFCSDCRMPLVPGGGPGELAARSEAHERARKIRPEFTHGALVRVAGGRNQSEAELIQNLLLEEGVPSILRRTAGFDVPDFLAAGPRDVLVPESGAATARDTLLETDLAPSADGRGPTLRSAALLLAGIVVGGALAALVAWLLIGGPA